MHVCEHFIYESSRYVSSVKATKTNYQRELSKLFQIKLPYAAAKIVMGVQTDKNQLFNMITEPNKSRTFLKRENVLSLRASNTRYRVDL